MKKFKNKRTGEIVSQYNETHYQDNSDTLVHKRFIINSCDWEEVKEKEYEVLSLSYFSDITPLALYNKTEDGERFYKEDIKMHVLLSYVGSERAYERDVKIHSVKRLSDGEVFTVGDLVKNSMSKPYPITEFRLRDGKLEVDAEEKTVGGLFNHKVGAIEKVKPLYTTFDGVDRYEYQKEHWVINGIYEYTLHTCKTHIKTLDFEKVYKLFSTKEKALEYVESVRPKPLFTTEDGVDIFEGDEYTFVWINDSARGQSINTPYTKKAEKLSKDESWSKSAKFFSTKEKAEDFILMNKPLLSLEDLLSVWSSEKDDVLYGSPLFKSFKNLAKSKLG